MSKASAKPAEKNPPVAINSRDVPPRIGTGYPAAYAEICRLREKRKLGDVFGLTQLGINLTTLPPGQGSSLRHWHENEDEFVYIIEGELTLITDDGEQIMTPGMCAGFRAGAGNGHHLVNRSDKPASYLEIGTRAEKEVAYYSDIDLMTVKDGNEFRYTTRDGKPVGKTKPDGKI